MKKVIINGGGCYIDMTAQRAEELSDVVICSYILI